MKSEPEIQKALDHLNHVMRSEDMDESEATALQCTIGALEWALDMGGRPADSFNQLVCRLADKRRQQETSPSRN